MQRKQICLFLLCPEHALFAVAFFRKISPPGFLQLFPLLACINRLICRRNAAMSKNRRQGFLNLLRCARIPIR